MTEDLGTPTRPHALTGEQWRLEVRTDDPPSPSADERWIRSDLDGGDRVATLKCGDGTEIPLFPTGTAEETVREARRYRVGGQTVYAPLAPVNEAAYPSRRVQHDGQTHAFHDRVAPGSGIPDSVVNRLPLDEGSGTSVSDTVGSADGTLSNGGTWVSDTAYRGDTAPSFDASNGDYGEWQPRTQAPITWTMRVRLDSTFSESFPYVFGHDLYPAVFVDSGNNEWALRDTDTNDIRVSDSGLKGSVRILACRLTASQKAIDVYDASLNKIGSNSSSSSSDTFGSATMYFADRAPNSVPLDTVVDLIDVRDEYVSDIDVAVSEVYG